MGLDECENLIRTKFQIECACTGDDAGMKVYVTTGQEHEEIKRYIAEKTNINSSAFHIVQVEELPRNEAGKILYSKL